MRRIHSPVDFALVGGLFEVPIPLELAVVTAAHAHGPARNVRLSALKLAVSAEEALAQARHRTGGVCERENEETHETARELEDDLGPVGSVELFVESTRPGSSLPRRRIAFVVAVAGCVRELVFVTDPKVDLLPYVHEGARLESFASGRVPPETVSFTGRAVLSIEVP